MLPTPVGEGVTYLCLVATLPDMRTTVRLQESLLKRAKQRAADEGRSLTSLIEEALELVLAEKKARGRRRVTIPVSRATGGVLPGVHLDRSAEMEDLMDGR